MIVKHYSLFRLSQSGDPSSEFTPFTFCEVYKSHTQSDYFVVQSPHSSTSAHSSLSTPVTLYNPLTMRVLSFIPAFLLAAASFVAAAPTPADTSCVAAPTSSGDDSALQPVISIITTATTAIQPLSNQLCTFVFVLLLIQSYSLNEQRVSRATPALLMLSLASWSRSLPSCKLVSLTSRPLPRSI